MIHWDGTRFYTIFKNSSVFFTLMKELLEENTLIKVMLGF